MPESEQHIETEFSMDHNFEAIPKEGQEEYSISFPTVINGKPHTRKQAITNFNNTGKYLGLTTRNKGESDKSFYGRVGANANRIHERQAEYYLRGEGRAKLPKSYLDLEKRRDYQNK